MLRLLSIASGVLVVMGAFFAIAQQQTGNPKEGKVTYERLCLRCHGEKLDGRGPRLSSSPVRPPTCPH
jgi:mono/diheme cytochrome c family protein